MKIHYLALVSLLFMLVNCKKNTDMTPVATPDYFITAKADQQTYTFDKGSPYPSIVNLPPGNPLAGPNYPGAVSMISMGKSPQLILIQTVQALSGKPESIPISSGRFVKDQFSDYYTSNSKGSPGTLTITKVDNEVAEGTFTMDVYFNNTKLSLTDGRFRVKFVK